jgi:hypothetical protein
MLALEESVELGLRRTNAVPSYIEERRDTCGSPRGNE